MAGPPSVVPIQTARIVAVVTTVCRCLSEGLKTRMGTVRGIPKSPCPDGATTNYLSPACLSTRFRKVIPHNEWLKFCWPSPTLVLHMVLVLTDGR